MIRGVVRSSTRRPGAVLALSAILLLAAASLAVRLKLDALPDVTPNQVLVSLSRSSFGKVKLTFSGRPLSSTGVEAPSLRRPSMTSRTNTSGADAPAVIPTA